MIGPARSGAVVQLPVMGDFLPGPGYPLDSASHLREHLVWMRLQGRSDRTLAARRRAVVRLAEHLGADPAHAGFDQLYGWQVALLRVSKTLVRHQTALVRPFYGWLHALGHRADNPAALLPLPKARRGVPRPIAEATLITAITSAPPRLLPWLLLAGWSGLRAEEIARIAVEDFFVDADGETWVRVLGKGDVIRHAPIPRWAWPLIAATLPATGRAWRRVRGRDRNIAPVTAQHVSQYCNHYLRHKVGVDDTLHSLRHRVATLTYEQTGDLRLVQDLLGHAQLSTTAVYTRVAPARMAVAVNALPRPDVLPRPERHLHVVDPTTAGGTA